MYLLSRMTEGNTEEFRKKKLSRVVFLVKLNENSDPTLRDRQSREQNSDPSFFFFFLFFYSLVFFRTPREFALCLFAIVCACNVKGGWVFTGQRAVEIRDREEERRRVKCHGDYLMSDVIVKTVVEP